MRPIAILGLLCACGEQRASSASAPAPAPPVAQAPAPSAPNAAPATPARASTDTAAAGNDPCRAPNPLTLELEGGVPQQTAWGLELTYAVDEDPKRGPGYMFMLRDGTRHWETRRDSENWMKPLKWRGFCWRGLDRPEHRAKHVRLLIAPLCKDGKLQELGGCGDLLQAK